MPTSPSSPPPPRVQLLGSTRLTRIAAAWLCDQGRARVVGIDPGDEDESRPWFAPVRGFARDNGIPLERRPADLVLDLDPDARPDRGEGMMVRVLPPPGAASADVNRAFLLGGDWALVVTPHEGGAAWATVPLRWTVEDDAETLLARATLAGVEALAEGFEALLAGATPTPLPRPLRAGRWKPQEAYFLWERPAAALAARIRACGGPWGGARTSCGETILWLLDARVVDEPSSEGWLPGTIVALDRGMTIATGKGCIRVERVRPGWRPARWAGEWAAEVGLGPGYQLV